MNHHSHFKFLYHIINWVKKSTVCIHHAESLLNRGFRVYSQVNLSIASAEERDTKSYEHGMAVFYTIKIYKYCTFLMYTCLAGFARCSAVAVLSILTVCFDLCKYIHSNKIINFIITLISRILLLLCHVMPILIQSRFLL
jgi:hypothetical protein